MNILIHGFHHPQQIAVLERFLSGRGPSHVFHICSRDAILAPAPGRTVESMPFDDAGNGRYDLSSCPPLEEPLLERLLPCEAVVLKQMDRLEPWDPGLSEYAQRKALYLKHVRYWNHVLLSRNIDFFLGSSLPHEVYDSVILGLCRIHGIRTQFFFQSPIPDTVHPLNDPEEFTPDLPAVYAHLRRVHSRTPLDRLPLPADIEEEWTRQRRDTVPFYMNEPVRPDPRNAELNAEYDRVASNLEPNERYIYFPLHFQPELTTSPLGGQFCEQALALEMIDHHLPPGVVLAVKEHPMQGWIGRGRGFYERIRVGCPRVRFLPRESNSHELIRGALAVSTITGTAGWEALFRSKPVLLFGHIFYQDAPGVFRIRTNDDCAKALAIVAQERFRFDEKLLKLFLMALDATSVKAVTDWLYTRVSRIDTAESDANLDDFLRQSVEGVSP